ncbi:MAG: bifunctional phosphoribosyl-AMP cyclohydrolase/phosphoribosyl-ATP diphosphatase HisIE [Acidobacteriota bacterium]
MTPRTDVDPATLTYDERGLLPVIAQDVASGAVLMLAWADREAVERTLASGQAWFWSRSRRELWHKGATSGNTLAVVEVRTDCDRDALLYRVHAAGPACHRGTRSCFEPNDAALELGWLWQVLESRRAEANPEGSYTARLLAAGRARIAQKVAEEGAEVALAAVAELVDGDEAAIGAGDVTDEAADLLYHLLVLLLDVGVEPSAVAARLAARHRPAAAAGDSGAGASA